jgi:hypothetical protein
MEGMKDPETLEAMACWEGMALASNLLLQQFRMASDCSNVVQSLAREGMCEYGNVVQEIKARMHEFQKVEFVHERRTTNIDAHFLARRTIYLSVGKHVWFGYPPDGVAAMYHNAI